MRRLAVAVAVFIACAVMPTIRSDAEMGAVSKVDPATPVDVAPMGKARAGWDLVFSDEFRASAVDQGKWSVVDQDRGTHDGVHSFWRPEHVSQAKGYLDIKFDRDPRDPSCTNCFAGGAIDTKGKTSWKYGLFEARIGVFWPEGAQPAFWLMAPAGLGGCDGTAANGAEIDIVEANKLADKYHTDVHRDSYTQCPDHLPLDVDAPNLYSPSNFHVFGLEWSPDYLKFTYDGVVTRTINNNNSDDWVADIAEYVRLSGDNFTSAILTNDDLPLLMQVDWIRIYTAA